MSPTVASLQITEAGDERPLNIADFRLADLLAAIADLATALDELEIDSESINLNTDQLEGKLDSVIANTNGAASQVTLAAILAKIIAAPSTEAKQDTANASLASIVGSVDGVEAALATLATETKLEAVRAMLASIDGHVDSLEATTDGLEGALATLNGKDFATQTTAAAILAKLSSDPATQTTLAAVLAAVDGLETLLTPGIFSYASGTAGTTVDVPTGAQLRKVTVAASAAGAATITIGGGATITVPAGETFDEQIVGIALGADAVIGGSVSSYYVAWTS